MSYKGEGYSTTFNYGIRTYLRRKTTKGKTLALVSLNPEMRAIVLFKGDELISSRCYNLPHDKGLKKAVEAQSLKEYNLYKNMLYCMDLSTLDTAEILMLSDDYNN